MPNTPCKNPALCGVQSHRPGTDAPCARVKAKKPVTGGRSLGQTPSLSTGFSFSDVERAEIVHREVFDQYHSMSPQALAIREENVRRNEDIMKLAEDERIVKIASEVNVNEPGNRNVMIYSLQYAGFQNTTQEPGRLKNAMAAVLEVGWREDDRKGAFKNRASLLAEDGYIREYADAITQSRFEDDDEANSDATHSLHQRMKELGVPEGDVTELAEKTCDRITAQWNATLDHSVKNNPAGSFPEWEPFEVAEAVRRSAERLERARVSARSVRLGRN